MHRGKKASSLDHLVSECENRWRQFEAEPFGSLEVDHGLVFCRLLERQIARLLAAQDAIDIAGRSAEQVDGLGHDWPGITPPFGDRLMTQCN